MAPITYNPTFSPTPYQDNHDRVKAFGPNGFNERFSNIEQEFQDISKAVGAIGLALNALGEQVGAPVTVSLTPTMLPYRADVPGWSPVLWGSLLGGTIPQGSFAERPPGEQTAKGVLPLDLPGGVRLSKLAVRGELAFGGKLTTELIRELRAAPFTSDALLPPLDGFSAAAVNIPATPEFTGDTHVFYLVATATGPGAGEIHLRGFELTYLPPTT